jgi:hypothetical protein
VLMASGLPPFLSFFVAFLRWRFCAVSFSFVRFLFWCGCEFVVVMVEGGCVDVLV